MQTDRSKIPVRKKKPKDEALGVNPAISRAMFHIKAAMPKAEADSTRPAYHFHAPAQWMSQPNGMFLREGWQHIFYQFNPYADSWGGSHWGHARSRDLVHWEYMPIALCPSEDKGEEHCLSGCAVVDGDNRPMIFYTSVGKGKDVRDYSEQWTATGDGQFMVWRKHSANPMLVPSSNAGLSVKEWRHPFIFREADRTFMLTGGKLEEKDGGAVVLIHEADNKELTRWTHKGILFRHPCGDLRGLESPNFFRLDDKYVLLLSRDGPVEYFVGLFNPATLAFTPEKQGLVDNSDNFHATGVFKDASGRILLVGGIQGFRSNLGWNGCISLPRLLSLDLGGSLVQEPASELHRLRCGYVKLPPFMLNKASQILQDVRGSMLELSVEFEPKTAKSFGLKVRRSDDGKRGIAIHFRDGVLDVLGTQTPVKPDVSGVLSLRVFLDRSVLEIFAQHRVCVTKVVYPDSGDLGVEIFSEAGDLTVRNVEAWTMRPAM